LRCPQCHHPESRVLDSRPTEDGAVIRRRRECLACDRRFTTYEKVETEPLLVVKKDGRREQFDAAKILGGMVKACEKRPIPLERLEHAASSVERDIRSRWDREVPSSQVGELVMEHLREIDEVAYVRFASVYRQFADVDSFLDELTRLLQTRRGEREGEAGGDGHQTD